MTDEERAVTENQLEEPEKKEDLQSPKKFIVNKDNPPVYEQKEKKSGKKLFIIIVILVLLFAGGYFVVRRIIQPAQVTTTPTPAPVSSPIPSPTSQPVLNRSDWSLEILNGSGITGAAKSRADKIQTLGYPVTKVGNADGGASGTKETYSQTQILVKKSLQDKVELIIADLKDIIKIASVAGELKDSTASARIIIGKDSI